MPISSSNARTHGGRAAHKSFAEEGYRRFSINGILWEAGREVLAGGAPVKLGSPAGYLRPPP